MLLLLLWISKQLTPEVSISGEGNKQARWHCDLIRDRRGFHDIVRRIGR
jgi:hypothetical protein